MRHAALFIGLVLALAGGARAAQAPVDEPGAIVLNGPAGVAPGAEEIWENNGVVIVRNVRVATLTPVLPAKGKATGAAVIVAPGGAFRILAIDHEGYKVAHWLADRGIAAFVLKYRLVPTPADPAAFQKAMMTLMAGVGQPGRPPPSLDHMEGLDFAVEDAQAALTLVRAHAAAWGIDPKRVGMVGFSAGAMTTLAAGLAGPDKPRPDFIAPIYGPTDARAVPADAPPMFNAIAVNDEFFGHAGYGLIDSWIKARRPVEFHLYGEGRHGFGMNRQGLTSDHWIGEFLAWLQMRGIVPKGS
jgi:acetyl esterase/lipase